MRITVTSGGKRYRVETTVSTLTSEAKLVSELNGIINRKNNLAVRESMRRRMAQHEIIGLAQQFGLISRMEELPMANDIDTLQKIERLSECEEDRRRKTAALDSQRQALIDEILTPEIKAKLKEIDEELAPFYQAVNAGSEEEQRLRDEITADVVELKHSVKGRMLQVVYVSPRDTWNTAALEGYAAAHPELNQFKKTGAAGVSFRKVAQKGE